jgi:competence protein ComEA
MKQKMMDYILHHREKTLKYLVAFLFILIALFILLGKDGEEEILIEGRENTSTEDQQLTEGESPGEAPESKEIFVHLSGAVNKPGVLKLSEGTRVYEAVEMAGGLGVDADSSGINLARTLQDEERIHIPREGEVQTNPVLYANPPMQSMGGGTGQSGLININTADSAALQTLTGIGPSTAEKILDYRQSSGPFRSIEQIKEVSGIGEKTYEKFKDKICI